MTQQKIKIGTSGYSYPGPPPKGWYGVFYPASTGKKFDELGFYSRHFNIVEINTSFYRPPSEQMARAWDRKTPQGFEFAVKLWQKFTHPKKIGGSAARQEEAWEPATQNDVDAFRAGIEPLISSGKLGSLLLQYPPSFQCTSENIEKLGSTLRAFRDYPKVVEVRHRSWSDRDMQVRGLFAEGGASGF